ncbi:MAG: host attachment protein [Mesorhizobium sp.]|uniref:host attachment protein n=2 Tax=Mesorhizobium sp. TaxID=1871066 RepID=UPI0012082D48|nr:host attachment protein [Mesorhizobium sp.]TIP03664.1 MAG: host attachment protein [Mesorhizobium sp.]TJV71859.1 MAG: host attachment protein [Mesorhizobium sp.]
MLYKAEPPDRELTMKPTTTWVLIADGARGRIVRNLEATGDAADRLHDLTFETDQKQLREIMADRPGRSFASEGSRRSAMEYHSDPVREQEAAFADMLIEQLERRHAAHEFDRLAIVAEPRMLGLLRQKLSPKLSVAVIKEVSKDWTKLSPAGLRRAIVDLGFTAPAA